MDQLVSYIVQRPHTFASRFVIWCPSNAVPPKSHKFSNYDDDGGGNTAPYAYVIHVVIKLLYYCTW